MIVENIYVRRIRFGASCRKVSNDDQMQWFSHSSYMRKASYLRKNFVGPQTLMVILSTVANNSENSKC